MAFNELRQQLIARLDEADRGDRGWFLITRLHLSSARLRDVAKYLYDLSGRQAISLEARNYADLAGLVGVVGREDPGITLRRHHLLAMETPLNLLHRTDGRSWGEIALTPLGVSLATEADSNAVMETALQEIIFCRQPYYTASREQEYGDFEVRPYRVTVEVLRRVDGWIDRDEYDLFVSRIRIADEAEWAVQAIREFRQVNPQQRVELLREVKVRVPGDKRYQNWRDMALHTFSLFSLGLSAIRTNQLLRLTETLTTPVAVPVEARAPRIQRAITLRIPEPPANPGLLTPPTARDLNGGSEAELLVAKLLETAGWSIVFYTNRRGFGFDLWARKDDLVMVVEVKSSLDRMGTITLTPTEHAAAQQYGANFYIGVVENLAGAPNVRFVQNPSQLVFQEQQSTEYVLRRETWEHRAAELER